MRATAASKKNAVGRIHLSRISLESPGITPYEVIFMKMYIISVLILLAIACSSQSTDTVNISRDSGMAILANLTESSSSPSEAQESILQNQTNQTGNTSLLANDDLWSWGKIPIGYEVSDNGTLINLAEQEWAPSI
jgi:hypothetical protein